MDHLYIECMDKLYAIYRDNTSSVVVTYWVYNLFDSAN